MLGGKFFYNLLIKPQLFNELVSLDCDPHNFPPVYYTSSLPQHLGEIGRITESQREEFSFLS